MKRVIIMLAVILAGSGLCSTFLSAAAHAEEPIAVAKPKSGGCDASLFGMPAWYNGLSGGSGCEFTPIKNGEGMANARKTITNALIGMAIAILAASIVNAIGAAIR